MCTKFTSNAEIAEKYTKTAHYLLLLLMSALGIFPNTERVKTRVVIAVKTSHKSIRVLVGFTVHQYSIGHIVLKIHVKV